MLIAAGLVGLYVAYFFGLRVGAWSAAVAAAMFFVAVVAPPLAPIVYLASIVGLVGVALVGPRQTDSARRRKAVSSARKQFSRLWKIAKR